MAITYYLMDIETTGTRSEAQYHEVVEISVVNFSTKVQINRIIKAEHPERASLDALKITNKTKKDLLEGISKSQAVKDINEYFQKDGLSPKHRCIVGHKIISFDKRFLHELWKSENSEFPADLWLDTYTLMKLFLKKNNLDPKTKLSLDNSCDLLGIKKIAEGQHTAKVDARNNYFVIKELMETHNIDFVPEIKTFKHVIPGFKANSSFEEDVQDEIQFEEDD